VQKEIKRKVTAHERSAMPSRRSGGTARSGSGSLAAIFARVWRANECGAEGVYIGALAW
jgi:hypothetical protein